MKFLLLVTTAYYLNYSSNRTNFIPQWSLFKNDYLYRN